MSSTVFPIYCSALPLSELSLWFLKSLLSAKRSHDSKLSQLLLLLIDKKIYFRNTNILIFTVFLGYLAIRNLILLETMWMLWPTRRETIGSKGVQKTIVRYVGQNKSSIYKAILYPCSDCWVFCLKRLLPGVKSLPVMPLLTPLLAYLSKSFPILFPIVPRHIFSQSHSFQSLSFDQC